MFLRVRERITKPLKKITDRISLRDTAAQCERREHERKNKFLPQNLHVTSAIVPHNLKLFKPRSRSMSILSL